MRGSEASQRLLKGFSACTIWRSGGGEKGARCALWDRHLFLLLAARRRGERWVGGAAHLTDGARHGPRRNFLLRRRRGGGGVPGKRHGLRTRRSRRGSRRRRKSLQGETSARAKEVLGTRAWRPVPVKPLDAGLPPQKLLALREIRGVTKSFILFKEPSYCLPMMYRSAALVVSPDR